MLEGKKDLLLVCFLFRDVSGSWEEFDDEEEEDDE